MKSLALGAMVLSMVAVACGGGSETTTSTSSGSGGATTGTMTTTSGSNTTSDTTATTGSNTTSDMTTTTGSSTTSTGTGVDNCANASDCAACVVPSATDNSCGVCCGKVNPDSQKKFIGFVVGDCICAAMSPCFTACGGMGTTMPAVCSDPAATLTAECNTCFDGILQTDACVKKATTSCVADGVCKLLGVCAGTCAG